jgi:Esterase-like activity of phytase/PEP-CTERM motif
MFPRKLLPLLIGSAFAAASAQAAPTLIAIGSLSGSSAGAYADLSGLNGSLENGVAANLLGGLGSGLAWAGGNTFLALPDRGPNASTWNAGVDNTTSYISRFQTIDLSLKAAQSGNLPYTLTPTLTSTTLLYSGTALNYGSSAGMVAGSAVNSEAGKYYFSGRSDNFGAGSSLNSQNARLDPEAIRVSNDGKSVFVADEYGHYVYQFDRATGERIRSFALPETFGVARPSSTGAAEISGNTSGRVANKGMEGLAITPDGKTLVGFMQSALIQDGGDGAKANRIVMIDIASGKISQFAYDNTIGGKSYNSSEILALNDHQFLVLERDGKGLGDGSAAKVKQVWAVDLSGATDVSGLTGEAALKAKAPVKTLFLDLASALKSFGLSDTQIPAKLEGMAFGEDIVDNGVLYHTLYVANDNDFVQDVAGSNQFFVFRFTDDDLGKLNLDAYAPQEIAQVPEPGSLGLLAGGVGLLGMQLRRRRLR